MGGEALRAEWRKELGFDPPALAEAELRGLLQSVRKAKRTQRDALTAAIDAGLGFVPALLRIPLKRILFP